MKDLDLAMATDEERLAGFVGAEELPLPSPPGPAPSHPHPGISTPYGLAALEAEAGEVASTPEGGRRNRLNKAGFRIGQLVTSGDLDASEAEERLMRAARTAGVGEREARATLSHAIPDGQRQPRAVRQASSARGGASRRTSPAQSGPSEAPGQEASERVTTVCLADVEPEQVGWLWAGRIPLGKLTVIDGDPGLGKSTLTLELAARLSRGQAMPGHEGAVVEAASTLFLTAEDGLGDTIRPRLEAAGADLSKVHAWTAVKGRMPQLGDTLELLLAAQHVHAKLIVVDPLMAFLGEETNSSRDSDIRRLLGPVAKVAENLGAAFVVVRHLNKANGPSAIYRGGGSIGIIGAARSAVLVARDPQDPEARVIASTKSNLGPKPPALRFKLSKRYPDSPAASITWMGESSLQADDLVQQPAQGDGNEERSAVQEASAFLSAVLGEGPFTVNEIKQAAKDAGISWRAVERAKAQLGVKSRKSGSAAPWRWSLQPEDRQTGDLAVFGENEVGA